MLIRGGTSKGAYFLASDLPSSRQERDALLLSIMGSPHPDQIDGIGGGHPLRSKVAIVARSTEPGLDIDFLFAQVVVDKPLVDTSPNCGNILSGVGPFAIERGLIRAREGSTTVRVRTLNTGTIAELVVSTPGGAVSYQGEARIDGVPGTSAPILVNFVDVAGSVCGALLPTGHTSDVVAGIRVTCIDNGMPVVLIPAASVQRTGYEGVAQFERGCRFEGCELWKEAGQTEEKVKAIRRTEGEEAATILGAGFEGMDLGDYPLELDRAAMERLTTAIREFAPTVILTHTKEDPFNPDHGVAYLATEKARQLSSGAGVASAFKTISPPALLLFEPHQPELCGFYPNTFLNITPVFEKKRAAMEVMGAQGYLREYYSQRASQRANHARRICGDKEIKFAEAFQRITPTVLKGL